MSTIESMTKLDIIIQISYTQCKISYTELKTKTKKELINIYYDN